MSNGKGSKQRVRWSSSYEENWNKIFGEDKMSHYILRLKDGKARVDRILAKDRTEAKYLYMRRKQMDAETFDKLYIIEKDTPKEL